MNLEEFKNWAVKQGGNIPKTDGGYAGQCVSLVNQYCHKVLGVPAGAWGNAKDWATNAVINNYFDKPHNVSKQRGDLVVYPHEGGGFGHIAIALDAHHDLEQNYNYTGRVRIFATTRAGVILRPKAQYQHKIHGITAQSSKKSVAEIANEVLAGKWGNGEDRKQRLQKAGYNYAEVQNAVNALIAKRQAEALAKAEAEAKAKREAEEKAKMAEQQKVLEQLAKETESVQAVQSVEETKNDEVVEKVENTAENGENQAINDELGKEIEEMLKEHETFEELKTEIEKMPTFSESDLKELAELQKTQSEKFENSSSEEIEEIRKGFSKKTKMVVYIIGDILLLLGLIVPNWALIADWGDLTKITALAGMFSQLGGGLLVMFGLLKSSK